MRYVSTRGAAPRLDFEAVLLTGLARDGGLYVPETWPRLKPKTLAGFSGKSYAEVYWDEPLPETRETARKGLKRNRAEYATILDLDQGAKLVETLSTPS